MTLDALNITPMTNLRLTIWMQDTAVHGRLHHRVCMVMQAGNRHRIGNSDAALPLRHCRIHVTFGLIAPFSYLNTIQTERGIHDHFHRERRGAHR